MSLVSAARAVYASRLLWPVFVFIAVLTALGALLPTTGLWQVIALSAPTLVIGYELSVSRAVVEGTVVLPSPATALKPVVRRGFSAEFVLFFALAAPLIVILVGEHALHHRHGDSTGPVATIILVAVLVPIEVIALAQYVAFDRLRPGLRYGQAWRRFRAHSHAGLRVVGYWWIVGLLRAAVRYALLVPLDPYSVGERSAARRGIAHGSLGAGLALIAIELALAALWAPWGLINAHCCVSSRQSQTPVTARRIRIDG